MSLYIANVSLCFAFSFDNLLQVTLTSPHLERMSTGTVHGISGCVLRYPNYSYRA